MNNADNNAMNSDFEPRVYELGFLITPTLTEDALTDAVDAIRKVIDEKGGSIIAEGAPALKVLAYEMSKMIANKRSSYTSAHFGWMKFESSPEAVESMKLEFDANNDLIRFIIVKTVREDTMASLPTKTFQGDSPKEEVPATAAAPVVVTEEAAAAKAPEEKQEVNEEELSEELEKIVIED